MLATNLDGPFLCTQAAAPLMLKGGGGAVVNIASISGLRASTLRVAYGTSKAALIHLTKQQAAELGDIGIRVNAIAPGPVDTAMAKLVHSAAIRATTTTASRWAATARRKRLPPASASCAAMRPATSTASAWPWTAASTPWASACRACAPIAPQA